MEVHKVILFAVFEILLVHFVQISKCTKDMDNWRAHEKRINSFSCGPPQPRSFKFEEVIDEKDVPDINSNVFPKMTVLHRCDARSGCCPSSTKVCAPQITEDVSITFRILTKTNRRRASDGPRDKYLHVIATNHTRCSCQTAHDLPK